MLYEIFRAKRLMIVGLFLHSLMSFVIHDIVAENGQSHLGAE
ncbi:hypothetical protein CPter291_3104 [Collimonas pratensis]|uniref:Uncharacterized protein n=1 Tax=Collimonas pratensis TaxID=279113 RepID=A0ABM5Z8C5_9BURK|nr:hypothetical protein CPter291_3104 [Collimonas pratensis]